MRLKGLVDVKEIIVLEYDEWIVSCGKYQHITKTDCHGRRRMDSSAFHERKWDVGKLVDVRQQRTCKGEEPTYQAVLYLIVVGRVVPAL